MNAYLNKFHLQDTDGTCDIDDEIKDTRHIIYQDPNLTDAHLANRVNEWANGLIQDDKPGD